MYEFDGIVSAQWIIHINYMHNKQAPHLDVTETIPNIIFIRLQIKFKRTEKKKKLPIFFPMKIIIEWKRKAFKLQ